MSYYGLGLYYLQYISFSDTTQPSTSTVAYQVIRIARNMEISGYFGITGNMGTFV